MYDIEMVKENSQEGKVSKTKGLIFFGADSDRAIGAILF